MSREFNAKEIRDAAMTARVHSPGFTEDRFESLMELEKHIADSGYLEAVRGLLRLDEEKGISCNQVLDACEKLLKQKTRLERDVLALEKRVESLITQRKQISIELEQVQKETAKAGQELGQIRSQCTAAEKNMDALNKKLEKEKQRIGKEIEEYYRQANVTKEEVITASQIKAAVENCGFTLELMLGLSKEFAGHKNVRKELSEGLEKHDSLNKFLKDLATWSNEEKTRVTDEIHGLESQKETLKGESVHLKNVLSKLQADIKGEEQLRRFYYRYVAVSGLMEHLAGWNQIFFVRCTNPAFVITGAFDANSGNAQFWTDKPPSMCPQCGYRQLVYDERIYQTLGRPVGFPGKLTLGEYNAQEQKKEKNN
ncbi:hypothetical protein ACFLUU_01835 [Chloroflexota bacterium]